MASYPLTAIVLRKTKLGETDVILTLLSEDGREVRAVAKGLRKPGSRFGGRLEPYSVVDLLLHSGRNLEVIAEARMVASHAGLREDLVRSAAASVVVDLVDKIAVEGQTESRLFALSYTTLDVLEQARESALGSLVVAFLLKALAMHGYRPELRACVNCAGALHDDSAFSLSGGGMVCSACGDIDPAALRFPEEARAWLDRLMVSTMTEVEQANMPAAAVADCYLLVRSFIAYHVPARLKALDFFGSLLAG